MSLLIDALKKAEQEKKEAAKRLKEAQEKSGQQILLQTNDQADLNSEGQNNGAARQESVQSDPVIPEKKSTSALSLSPLDDNTPDQNLQLESTAADSRIDSTHPPHSLKKEITAEHAEIPEPMEENDLDEGRQSVSKRQDNTFALNSLTIEDDSAPFDDTVQPATRENLVDTLSSSRASKSVVSAAQLVKDIGGREAPTPVAAQTVFTAVGGGSTRRQILEWTVFLGLFAVILTAAGAFYYLKITPLTPETSSPLVAKGIEADLTPALNIPLPQESILADTTGVVAGENNLPEDSVIPEAASGQTVTQIQQETETVPPVAVEETTETIDKAQPETSEAEAAPVRDRIGEAPGENVVLPEKIQVEQEAIAISRTKSVDKKNQLINTAYAEYNNGNYAVAEAAYQGVLDDTPDNRDALLGLAAIAWRKGNIQQAYEQYLKVLKLHPKDIAATTALINLQGNSDPVRNESVIKLMLREQPKAAFLYFTLGNNYAAQSRWADAQQAFFEAFRLEPDNPDYAYNLAVSLDRIGQVRAAMEYYSKALELADMTQVSFNTATVMARVSNLSVDQGSK